MTEQHPEEAFEPLIITPLADPDIHVGPKQVDNRSTADKAAFFRTHAGHTEAAQEQLGLLHEKGVRWGQQNLGVDLSRRPVTPQQAEERGKQPATASNEVTTFIASAVARAAEIANNLRPAHWDGFTEKKEPPKTDTLPAPPIPAPQSPPSPTSTETPYILGLRKALALSSNEATKALIEGELQKALAALATGHQTPATPAAAEATDNLPRRGMAALRRTPDLGVRTRARVPASDEMLGSLQTNIDKAEKRLEEHIANPPEHLTVEELEALLLNLRQAVKMAHNHYEDVATRGVEVEEEPKHTLDELANVLDKMKRKDRWVGLGHEKIDL